MSLLEILHISLKVMEAYVLYDTACDINR